LTQEGIQTKFVRLWSERFSAHIWLRL